jgi:hypothetical protein
MAPAAIAAARGIPVVGGLAANALGRITSNPAKAAQQFLQVCFIASAGSWVVFGVLGFIREDSGKIQPDAYIASAPSGLTPEGAQGDPSSGSGGEGNVSGSAVNQMKQGAKAAGVPESWASSPALWNILKWENGTRKNHIVWDNPANSENFCQPFNLAIPNRYHVDNSSSKLDKLAAGLKYIRDQYGTPEHAWAVHQQKGWY